MGSDESYFNVSLTVRDKVTRQCLQTTALKREESRSGFDRSPSAYQPNVIPLGQTDSKHTHTHTARSPDRCFISYRVCSSDVTAERPGNPKTRSLHWNGPLSYRGKATLQHFRGVYLKQWVRVERVGGTVAQGDYKKRIPRMKQRHP